MNKVLITNYTSDTTDTTYVHICVQNNALLMHEKTLREVTRSQCSLPIVLYVHTQDYDNYAHENPNSLSGTLTMRKQTPTRAAPLTGTSVLSSHGRSRL